MNTHSQNGAGTVSLSFLPKKAANTMVTHNGTQATFQSPYLQDQKSLILGWLLL